MAVMQVRWNVTGYPVADTKCHYTDSSRGSKRRRNMRYRRRRRRRSGKGVGRRAGSRNEVVERERGNRLRRGMCFMGLACMEFRKKRRKSIL